MGRLLNRIWIGFTTSLITFIAFSSQIFIIWPWYGRVLSVELLQLLLPFNFFVAMIYWNYYLAISTDPGRVPRSWTPNVSADEGYEVKRLSGKPRYCRMCDAYKPPRSHHCRQCKRCVLRMDHHCPWLACCVGHYNYGHFLRFLFFVDVACSYHAFMITRRSIDAMNAKYWDGPTSVEFIFIVLNYVTCIPVLISVGLFSLYHFMCLLRNSTTIEGWEKDKAATLVRRGRIHEVKFPYNVGYRANIEATLGKNPLLWCWPSRPSGDGLSFPVVTSEDGTTQLWPPEDPTGAYDFDFNNEDDDDSPLKLPNSPWTYENGSVNPSLQPSNAFRRRAIAQTSGKKDESDDEDSHNEDYNVNMPKRRVRRGSEGYEIPMSETDREDILRRYILTRGTEAGHYRTYEPEHESPPTSSPSPPSVGDSRHRQIH